MAIKFALISEHPIKELTTVIYKYRKRTGKIHYTHKLNKFSWMYCEWNVLQDI